MSCIAITIYVCPCTVRKEVVGQSSSIVVNKEMIVASSKANYGKLVIITAGCMLPNCVSVALHICMHI